MHQLTWEEGRATDGQTVDGWIDKCNWMKSACNKCYILFDTAACKAHE